MSELFSAFGIDWRLLVINLINFGLLLLALWYFLYGPLTAMLEERRKRIAQGMHEAEAAGRKLREIEESRAAKLAEAGKEAETLMSHARKAAGEKEREIVAAGEAAAGRLLKDAESQAKELKAQALEESRHEVAKLIVLGVEKTMSEKANA